MNACLSRTNRFPLRAPGSIALAAMLVLATMSVAGAQQSFKSPEAAAEALVRAAENNNEKELLALFGPDGADIVASGDPVDDEAQRKKFVAAYGVKHEIEKAGDAKAILLVGEKDWPLPIPLVKKKAAWSFDVDEGHQEILFRRIGRNELDTIQACLAYVDAQNDYARIVRAKTGVPAYARRIVSEPGKKDGLYWPTEAGEEPSPLGELVASAAAQGYSVTGGRAPYHGYYYKILTRQGPAAHGGAYDYVVHDRMIGGFALVAWPATYRNSGVKTFIVSHEGVVFEKDLGPQTEKLAAEMTTFNPDETWKKVPDVSPVN